MSIAGLWTKMSALHMFKTDVLVVGAGPSGLMAAVALNRYNVNFTLIDKASPKSKVGHAISIQPRTLEILQTFGLQHSLDVKGCRQSEIATWTKQDDKFKLDHVGPTAPSVSPAAYILNTHQGNIEATLLDDLSSRGVTVQDQMELISYEYNTDDDRLLWPVKAFIRNLCRGTLETWYVKYIIGADGPQSAARSGAQIGFSHSGCESTWAVADVAVETNFPDARRGCAIRTSQGNCILLPLKDDGLRILLPVDSETQSLLLAETSCQGESKIMADPQVRLLQVLESKTKEILAPYHVNFLDVQWISQCETIPSLADKYQDAGGHVFLIGDTCHSHTFISSQDMNLCIGDAYNLTWKIALVLKGIARPELLDTYDAERRHIAIQSVIFDADFIQGLRMAKECEESDWIQMWHSRQAIVSGLRLDYPLNLLNVLIPRVDTSSAHEPVRCGRRLFPMSLIRHEDGNKVSLLEVMPSNCRFHIFIFAGKASQTPAFARLARSLQSEASPLKMLFSMGVNNNNMRMKPREDVRFKPENIYSTSTGVPDSNQTCHLDLFLIHAHDHREIKVDWFLAPFSTVWASRIFEDVDGRFHSEFAIDQSKGALVLVRPDGYVSAVTRIENLDDITVVLGRFLAVWG